MISNSLIIAIIIGILAFFATQTMGQGQATDETRQLVNDLIAQNKIFIATKSYCPYCRRVTSILSDWQVKEAKILPLDYEDEGLSIQAALTERSGSRTVPSIWFNGEFVRGGSETLLHMVRDGRWKSFLDANNVAYSEPHSDL